MNSTKTNAEDAILSFANGDEDAGVHAMRSVRATMTGLLLVVVYQIWIDSGRSNIVEETVNNFV